MLQGKLVTLMPLSKEYIEIVRQWRNDPQTYKYLFNHKFITPEQQEIWYNRIIEDK